MHPEIPEHIFREYDIRGVMDTEITEEFVYCLGFVLADFFKSKGHGRVLLGYDTRRNSALYHDILAKVLAHEGLHTVSLGLVPTPCLYFAVHSLCLPAGIMVTASHNPAAYGGFKLWSGKTVLSGEEIRGLYPKMLDFAEKLKNEKRTGREYADTPAPKQGFIQFFDIAPSYAEKVSEHIPPLSCSVLIDGGNGAAGRLCAEIFRRNGAQVQELFCEYAEDFPNHEPDPTKEKNIQTFLTALKNGSFQYGIALDGDGDRVVLADKNGRALKSDELMSIFIRDIAARKNNPLFLLDVKCSERLADEITQLRAHCRFMPTGHSLLKKGMLATDAEFGGEFSGHFFHKENWYRTDDGILTALRAVAILERNGLDLTALPAWPAAVSGEEIGIPCTKEQKKHLNRKLAEHFCRHYPQAEHNRTDGIRCVFRHGPFKGAWFLARTSQTSEQITLRFEAADEHTFRALKTEVLQAVGKILQA